MKFSKLLFLVIAGLITLASCDDDDVTTPLNSGMEITMRNSLQDAVDGPTEETLFSVLFGQADDAFDEMATLSNSQVEFPAALAQNAAATGGVDIPGLYRIDFTENSISYTLLPEADDPFWASNFRTLAAGVYDRYYFTFSENHNVSGFSSSNSSVNLRIDSDNVLVVEIGEGFNFNPGTSFTITLN